MDGTRAAKELLPPLLVFGLIAAAVVAASSVQGNWNGLAADPCRLADCFCEPFQQTLVLQPSNTFSNLGLVLVGLISAWTGARSMFPAAFAHHTNPMTRQPLLPVLFGITLTASGLGSVFYHASLSRVGEWTDLVGIYLFLSYLLYYNLSRLAQLNRITLAAAYASTNLALGVQMALAPQLQQIVFGALAAGAAGLEGLVWLKKRPDIKKFYLVTALAVFAAGAILWALDTQGTLCNPQDPVQWHAIWHGLTAVAALFLYVYYLSEDGG